VREPTVALAGELGLGAVAFQGNWIPHQLRPATEGGVFFVGDSAGHCLPLTAEGIRPAFYFALALGRELRQVLAGRATREQALARYAAFSAAHRWPFRALLTAQHLVGRLTDSATMRGAARLVGRRRVTHWMFERYLAIAPPGFVMPDRGRAVEPASAMAATAV
jgi:flavin-dependent dehydrogenase